MPMNPRLLRPTQGGFSSPDVDARAYLAAVRIADGSNLEPAVAKAISDFVIGCKADGIWDAIKSSCILAGARTLSGALVPLKGAAPTNNGPFVSGDYNRETGLVGNGTSKWLDSGRAGNADPQNNQHLSVYVSVAHTAGAVGAYIASGIAAGATGASDIGRSGINTANLFFRSQASTAAAGLSGGSTTGLIAVSRAASGSYSRRFSGSTGSVTQASQTPAASTVGVYRLGGESAGFAEARIAFYSVGESVDLALLDTRVSALITAIGAAIP